MNNKHLRPALGVLLAFFSVCAQAQTPTTPARGAIGKVVGVYEPQKHLYKASQQPTSEVRRHATWVEDVYLVFGSTTDENKATIQVFVKPLVRWVWIGGIVMFLGTVVTLVPDRRELKLVQRSKAEAQQRLATKGKENYEVA